MTSLVSSLDEVDLVFRKRKCFNSQCILTIKLISALENMWYLSWRRMWHFISTVRIPFTKECFAQSLDEIYPVVLFNWLILIRRAFLSIWLADLKWIKTLNTTGEQSLWNIHIHLQCSSTHLSKMRTAKCLYRVTNSNAHWNPACKPYRYSLHLYICYRFHITLDVVHLELAKLHNTCIDKQWKSLKPKSGLELVNPRMG